MPAFEDSFGLRPPRSRPPGVSGAQSGTNLGTVQTQPIQQPTQANPWDAYAPSKQFATGYTGKTPAEQIGNLYQFYYGRTPTSAELGTHQSNLTRGQGALHNIAWDLYNDARTRGLALPGSAAAGGASAGGASGTPLGLLAGTLDQRKLNDQNHWLKSPKYAWLSTARQFANTPDGFKSAFAKAQELYPQFFGNWRMEGDDSIVWGGQGALNPYFNGFDGFDVWENASNDDPNVPSAWGWIPHQTPGRGGNAIDDLFAQFQTPAYQVGPMAIPQNTFDALMAQLRATPAPAPTAVTVNAPPTPAPAPQQVPVGMPEVPTPLALNAGSVPQAVRIMAMALPQLIQTRGPMDPLVQHIMSIIGG